MTALAPLPIDAVTPDLVAALALGTTAVLVAPPGAGKTTRVPLVLAAEPWAAGKRILVLEPRRLAARAAAARMAQTLGETLGETVGYRVRFGTVVSKRTRIEVITEGIFTGLIQDDPSLDGVGAVLFDEFHERSLDADLSLALARDAQLALREDLRLVVMSATIDGARIARALGDAPVIASEGRAFPVETRYVGRDPAKPIEVQVADAVVRALRAETGSVLVFLPGVAEIRRTETMVRERRTDPAVEVFALHGGLDFDAQDRAIAPAPSGRRKVVLATSIAETSLTIEGVRVVVDSGLARVPRYEPDVGLTRLETVRVSRAAADQRRGRAGRIEPGVCYRLWDEPQTAALEHYAQPEILAVDLSALVLELAQWGVTDPAELIFLDSPPVPAVNEARTVLAALGALDGSGRITPEGKLLNRLPLSPRLARMVVDASQEGAGSLAAEVAAILTERGLGGNDIDLRHRIEALRRDRSARGTDAQRMARRWAEMASGSPAPLVGEGRGRGSRKLSTMVPHSSTPTRDPSSAEPRYSESSETKQSDRSRQQPTSVAEGEKRGRGTIGEDGPGPAGREPSLGAILALAYPERIAKNRGAATGAFLLTNGRGAYVDSASPLAREPFLAVAELVGSAAQSRVTLATAIDLADIEARFADRIEAREEVTCDAKRSTLRARRSRRLGAILLSDQPLPVTPDEATAKLLVAGAVQAGLDRLPWTKALRQWRDRVQFLRRADDGEWPDMSDAALTATAEAWLAPLLTDKTSLDALAPTEFEQALHHLLPPRLRRSLETEAPTHFVAPSGSRVLIDYEAEEGPKLAIRVQELFGLSRHPAIAGGRVPLVIELLSPAHRPVQVTRDLPQFWRGSYAAVRADMRGRYPRHPWPDDPASAPATRRAKPRGS
ncbi:MAG TPA: ATP-dependent helicase HrpB [Xanthobacteraceae bacterium]|nr:ATP-dependent helicase HrpB [Xanthobacteraceae bacterium]